jgi:predicted ribosomally synthesized peptide with nif11-like leader
MSQQQAIFFLDKMLKDDDFREAVIRIEDVETKMEYIHRQGFSFTVEELGNASNSMSEEYGA